MSFGIIDIVICVIVLIAALVGLKKGFVKIIAKSLAFFGSIILAVLFFKMVAKIIGGTSLYGTIYDKLFAWVNAKDATAMAQTIGAAGEDGVIDGIKLLGVPGFLANLLTKQVFVALEGVDINAVTLGEFYAGLLTSTSITLISFLAVFLVAFIILSIVVKTLKKISELPLIGTLDKLLGLVLNVAVVAVVICVAMVLVNYLVTLPAIGDKISAFMTKDMKLDDDTATGIAKYLYTQNPLLQILEKIGLGDVVGKFTPKGEEGIKFLGSLMK